MLIEFKKLLSVVKKVKIRLNRLRYHQDKSGNQKLIGMVNRN